MQNVKALKDSNDSKSNWWTDYNDWVYDKLKYTWYYRKFRYPIKDFITGLKNLIKWLPIVWRDRDWDSAYIMKVLSFKIKNTAHLILKNDIICDEDQEQIQRYGKIMLELIKRMNDDYYGMEYMDYRKTEHNWLDCSAPELEGSKFGYKKLQIVEKEETFDVYFAKYPNTKKLAEAFASKYGQEAPEKSYIAMTMAHMRQKKANELLFKIMANKIEMFWD